MPEWAHLLQELLTLISQNLTDALDYIRFRSVCRSWRSAAKLSNLPPQIPWLLLPQSQPQSRNEFTDDLRSFFSLPSQTLHRLNLPAARDHLICGSAPGVLIIFHPQSLSFSLLNPLTCSLIQTPSLAPFSTLLSKNIRYAHLSSSTADPVLTLTFESSPDFLFCRPGKDENWTLIPSGWPLSILSLVHHRGFFYALFEDNWCRVYGMSQGDNICFNVEGNVQPPVQMRRPYLVESSSGDLLLVGIVWRSVSKTRLLFDRSGRRKHLTSAESVGIFKLDVSGGGRAWREIDSIGEDVLFLGSRDRCFSIRAADLSSGGCKKNCIYFARAPYVSERELRASPELNGAGMLDLEDGSVEILRCYPPLEEKGRVFEGTWYTPSIL